MKGGLASRPRRAAALVALAAFGAAASARGAAQDLSLNTHLTLPTTPYV
jgi:hypothetical protein